MSIIGTIAGASDADELLKKAGQSPIQNAMQQQTPQVTTQPVIGGPAPVPGAPTAQGTGAGGQSQQRGSGRFTNIQKYLKANQSNTMGQQLGQKVEEEAQTPLSQIGTAREDVQNKLAQENQRLSQADQLFDKVNKFTGKQMLTQDQYNASPMDLRVKEPGKIYTQAFQPASYDEYTNWFNQNNAQLADQDFDAFGKIRQGLTDAPKIENMTDLNMGAQKVADLAQAAGTEQGRFGLLNQFFGKPTYNTGQQRLDQLLLQGNPAASKELSQKTSGINKQTQAQLNALKGMYDSGLTSLADLTAQKQKAAQDLLGQEVIGEEQGTGLLGGLADSLESRVKEQTQSQAENYKRLVDLFSGTRYQSEQDGSKVMDLLRNHGVDLSKDIYLPEGVSPQTFLKPAQQANIAAVAKDDERARYLALQKLAGNSAPTLFNGKEQIGGFDPNAVFNRDEFTKIQKDTADRMANSESLKRAQADYDYENNIYNRLQEAWNRGDQEFFLNGERTGEFSGVNRKGMELWINKLRDKTLPELTTRLNTEKKPFGKVNLQELITKYMSGPVHTGGTGGSMGLL
jgi:hypothetical protein